MNSNTKSLVIKIAFLTVLAVVLLNCSSKVGFSAAEKSSSSSTGPTCTGSTGSLSGTVQDATNHNVLSGVSVEVVNGVGQSAGSAITAANGSFTVSDLPAGTYTVLAVHSGYITFDSGPTAAVTCGSSQMSTVALSPVLGAAQYRIILTWSGPPANWANIMNTYTNTVMDVDGYLAVPGYSDPVYWGNCNQHPDPGNAYLCDVTGAQQDVDDRLFNGPETITITTLNTTGTYNYYVANYSDPCNPDGLANSSVKVAIYSGSQLVKSYAIPSTPPPAGKSGMVFDVFSMVNGHFTDIMQYNDQLPINYYGEAPNQPPTCEQHLISYGS